MQSPQGQGSIKVNGKPLAQYLSEQKSTEVQKFLADEMRSMRRIMHK